MLLMERTHPKFQSQCESSSPRMPGIGGCPSTSQLQPDSFSTRFSLLVLTQVNQPHKPQAAGHAEVNTGFTCPLLPDINTLHTQG